MVCRRRTAIRLLTNSYSSTIRTAVRHVSDCCLTRVRQLSDYWQNLFWPCSPRHQVPYIPFRMCRISVFRVSRFTHSIAVQHYTSDLSTKNPVFPSNFSIEQKYGILATQIYNLTFCQIYILSRLLSSSALLRGSHEYEPLWCGPLQHDARCTPSMGYKHWASAPKKRPKLLFAWFSMKIEG